MMLRLTLYILLPVIAVAVAVSACGGGTVYSKFVSTPVDGLEKNDTVVFDVPPVALPGRYSMEMGHRMSVDTLDCRLYDNDGNGLGRGVSIYQYGFALPDTDLQKGDSLHVRVRHVMKREILPGITDIGLSMETK